MRAKPVMLSLLVVCSTVVACASADATSDAPGVDEGGAGAPSQGGGAGGAGGKGGPKGGGPAGGASVGEGGGSSAGASGGGVSAGGSSAGAMQGGAAGSAMAGAAGSAGSESGGAAGAAGAVSAGGGGGVAAGGAGGAGVAGAAGGVASGGQAGASGGAAGDYLLGPSASCAPKGDACSAVLAAEQAPVGSFRSDIYLPAYNETTTEPKTGGRFHVVGVAAADGDVTKIVIDGVDIASLGDENPSSTPPFEWAQVWPRKGLKAGDPIWVNFHSRAAKWDTSSSVQVTVETTGGKAIDASVPYAKAAVAITYVTTTEDMQSVVVHLKNLDAAPHTLSRVLVDGLDMTAADVACVAKPTLSPGETLLVTVPTCQPSGLGKARTVRVDLADGPSVVAGLRVAKPHFPVESWNTSGDCAFPRSNKPDNYTAYLAGGIDTSYFPPDNCGKCDCDPVEVLAEYPKLPGAYALPTEGILSLPQIEDTSRILAVSTGDESDGELYESNGVPRPHLKTKESLDVWERYPELLTFNGGKTNENVGTFAGTADIQGMDLYVAACAPYILPFPGFPSARSAYDYIRNARDNHAPLPTWLYAQGLSAAWGGKQPDPQEIIVQGLGVVAAGGKGLMWFQASRQAAEDGPSRWAAMQAVNRVVRGVRPYLREGDVTGLASSTGDALVEAVRSREAIVVPVVATKTVDGPDWPSCGLASATPLLLKHWQFANVSPSVDVAVPDDFAVADVFEVLPGSVVDVAPMITGRKLSLGPVALSNAAPARLFVLAASKGLRGEVSAAMQY